MRTVAIVEDNQTVRSALQELINGTAAFRCVACCGTGRDALLQLPLAKPDVVLMDIHLPGESGITCTSRLKEKLPGVNVIMLTVYKDTELIFQALKAGASGYLLKRAGLEDILRALDEVCSGGAPMSGEIARLVVQSFRGPTGGAGGGGEELSGRELEILQLLSEGLSNKEIAARINISVETVRKHLGKVYEKLHVRGRTEAVTKFLRGSSVTEHREGCPTAQRS
jgi:DNA-binding NarL/FixJ family response regulator